MLRRLAYALRCVQLFVLVLVVCAVTSHAQTTTFTYQGRLQDGGGIANGTYDFQFTLWDALSGGVQQPQPSPVTVTKTNVAVSGGIFTVQLDFGASAFPGADRYLEIGVRPTGGGGSFTVLTPRQQIASAPYSVKSVNSDTATNATQLGGVAANQFVVTGDARLSDARPPTAGSSNYVQNGIALQASSNFNISGNGTAGGTLSGNIVGAATQYNIGGNRVLGMPGDNNLFAGVGAGQSNSSGGQNSFVGKDAGSSNTAESANTFIGYRAGQNNGTSDINVFAVSNTFVGSEAGRSNFTGGLNSFLGASAGFNNTTGRDNTMLGANANVGAGDLVNATAIGFNALAGQSNSLVLGGINGVNGATADTNVGIGTTAPTAKLHVVGNGLFTGNLTVSGNVGIGTNSPGSKLELATDTGTYLLTLRNTSASNARVFRLGVGPGQSPGVNIFGIFDNNDTRFLIDYAGNVGIGTTDANVFKLQVGGSVGPNSDNQYNLGDATHRWNLIYAANGTIQTSDVRLKRHVSNLRYGLREVMQLRPVSFNWKDQADRRLNLGLIAQEVEQVVPEVVVREPDPAKPLGINYSGLVPVLINAVKEQQEQIEKQQEQLTRQQEQIKHQEDQAKQQRAAFAAQQHQIDALKKLVCRKHPRTNVRRMN